ncbi:MAG: hypothetical protein Q9190_002741 [Brigantiaea leucoxantha]
MLARYLHEEDRYKRFLVTPRGDLNQAGAAGADKNRRLENASEKHRGVLDPKRGATRTEEVQASDLATTKSNDKS